MSPDARSVAHAIREHESGGNFALSGGSGESGAYQFMPSTWVAYSTDVAGRVLPMTPGNEEYVAIRMIESWMDDGYSDSQIVLRWNHPAGLVHGCSSGENEYGVAWDSCEYQRKVLAILWGAQ